MERMTTAAALLALAMVAAPAAAVTVEQGGGVQCVSHDLRAAVRGYSLEWRNGFAHLTRWLRVRQSFDGKPGMTAATARRMAERYSASRWDPVVEALDCLERPAPPPPPPPVVTLHAGGPITEGETARLTVQLDRSSASDMAVRVTVSGAAGFGVQRRTHAVNIPAGDTAATLDVPTVDDSEDEKHSSIVASISRYPADPFTVGSPRIASALVRDDDETAPEPEPESEPAAAEVALALRSTSNYEPFQGIHEQGHAYPWGFYVVALHPEHGGRIAAPSPVEFDLCVSGSATMGADFKIYPWGDGGIIGRGFYGPGYPGGSSLNIAAAVFEARGGELCKRVRAQPQNAYPTGAASSFRIAALPDDHDDSGETVRIRLASVSAGVTLHDGCRNRIVGRDRPCEPGTLTFEIHNDGPLPREYLADFGHSLAGSVVDAVTARLDAPRDAGVAAALGALPGAGETLGLGGALRGSALSGAVGTPDGPSLAAWARIGAGEFESGQQTHALAGVDYADGPWLAGVGVLHAESDGASRGYDLDASLAAALPYAAWRSPRLTLWGAAGLGAGDVGVLGESGPRMEAATDWRMLALGGRYRLGEQFAATADGFHQRLESDDSPGMRSSRGETHRVRAGIEGALAAGPLRLTPAVRLRVDGGGLPAEESIEVGTGAALDLGRLTLAGDFAATLGGGAQWSRRSGRVTWNHALGALALDSGGTVAFSRGPWRAELAGDSAAVRWRAEF